MASKQKFQAVVDLYASDGKLIAAAGAPIKEPAAWLIDQGLVEPVTPAQPEEEA